MSNANSRPKLGTSVKYPTGAVITTFDPPPAGFDPLTADAETLRAHGYPRRPQEPAALARWQEIFGTPSRYMKATIVNRRERPHRTMFENGTETNSHWSGGVVTSSAPKTLFQVIGKWKVPKFKPPSHGDDRHVSIWVGIDGHGSSRQLFQAGVHAAMGEGDDDPDLYSWVEWLPDWENEIDLPVAEGDTIFCIVTADDDCLPGNSVHNGHFETIDDDHQLIRMHDGRVLDWKPEDGTWRLFNYVPTDPDGLKGHLHSQDRWSSVRDGHVLVPMHDGKVLDWTPENGMWRLWNYDPSNHQDCLPAPFVSSGRWKSVGEGHVLVPMHDGKVLDWVPDEGTWRLWNYVPGNHEDCLPGPFVSQGTWGSLDEDHTLVPMHDGRVLDWTTDGDWRLWNYDPGNHEDCLPGPAVAAGHWRSIDDDHVLVAMQDGKVLDWTSDGTWRLWNYDPHGHSMVAGRIMLKNETQHVHTNIHMEAPEGAFLLGESAEWIVERPGEGEDLSSIELTELLNYGSVEFTHAHAEKTGGGTMKAGEGNDIDMTENGKIISEASVSGTTVTCKFV